MKKIIKKVYNGYRDEKTKFDPCFDQWHCHKQPINLEDMTVSFIDYGGEVVTYKIEDTNAVEDLVCWEPSDKEHSIVELFKKDVTKLEEQIKELYSKKNELNKKISVFHEEWLKETNVEYDSYYKDGWDCISSPTGKCAYNFDSDDLDHCWECCVFCNEPEERK